MRARLRRAVVVVLLSAAGLLATAGPALAHSRLVSSNPVDGTSLDTGPAQVSLTFNEDMPPGFDVVTVIGPDGKAWQDGEVTTSGPTVSVERRPARAGRALPGRVSRRLRGRPPRAGRRELHPDQGRAGNGSDRNLPAACRARVLPPSPRTAAAARSGRGSSERSW